MLTNLQGIRALAALGVVVFHFGLMPATRLPFTIGAAGVDLFFVLSGFIIAHSAARSQRHFLAHRLIRVLPPYWIACVLAAAMTLPGLGLMGALDWLIQSLFYLPGPGGRPSLIFVGWTLVYELSFYFLYWLALRLAGDRAPWAVLPVLTALAAWWPLLLEFALGVVLFLAVTRRRISGRGGTAIAMLGAALLLTMPWLMRYDPDEYRSLARVACWGLPAAMIVLGAVTAERSGWAVRSRAVLLLGAASYALYLLHPIAIGVLIQLPAGPSLYPRLACLLATVAIVAISVGFHLWVEAPLLRRLRALLCDRPRLVPTRALEASDAAC